MKADGLQGIPRLKGRKTTHSNGLRLRGRRFGFSGSSSATRPSRCGWADLTYTRTHSGWVYAAFVLEVHIARFDPRDRQNVRVRWAEALPKPSSGARCRWGIHHALGTAAPVMACTFPSQATDSSPRQDNHHIHGMMCDAVRTLGVCGPNLRCLRIELGSFPPTST